MDWRRRAQAGKESVREAARFGLVLRRLGIMRQSNAVTHSSVLDRAGNVRNADLTTGTSSGDGSHAYPPPAPSMAHERTRSCNWRLICITSLHATAVNICTRAQHEPGYPCFPSRSRAPERHRQCRSTLVPTYASHCIVYTLDKFVMCPHSPSCGIESVEYHITAASTSAAYRVSFYHSNLSPVSLCHTRSR